MTEEKADRRTHTLKPIPIDPERFKTELAMFTALDPRKYSLFPIITPGDQSLPITSPGLHATPEHLSDLLSIYAERSSMGKREKQRIQQDCHRLVLDLVLSHTVVHSEDVQSSSAASPRASLGAIETPEDLFQRTQNLTLDDQSKIEFNHLIPRDRSPDPESTQQAQPPDKDFDSLLQTKSARRLLGEWQLGSDPSDYTWTEWRDPHHQPDTPIRRPVRPLPSPRTAQRFAQSQPTFGRYVPNQIPTSQINANPLLPNIRPFQSNMRASPPPVLQSSQSYPDIGPSTQIERGVFGGRLEPKARKKPAKKRVGGF